MSNISYIMNKVKINRALNNNIPAEGMSYAIRINSTQIYESKTITPYRNINSILTKSHTCRLGLNADSVKHDPVASAQRHHSLELRLVQ